MKQEYKKVNWNEQFKIRPRRNASRKHEIIKLLIVLNLLEKNKKNLQWIRIYTEFPIGSKKITDVYYENVKTNEIICYEIQNNISKSWLKKTNESYNKFDVLYFKTDWILVKEKEIDNNIERMEKQIKQII
ncbi:MAG TPA: hypothetical protein ENH06_00200 [bacterium]|nr:hypothetical protein [bacterium]